MSAEAQGLTVATRNIVSRAVPKLRKLAWLVITTPSDAIFQKNFMPTIAYTDISRTSSPPISTKEEVAATAVSRISLMPRKGFDVLINFMSFENTRNIRATTMTLALILSDTADTIEITTTMKSMELLGSLKYLLGMN
jgi:hypothetical protein